MPPWSKEDDRLLVSLVRAHGCKWQRFANGGHFPKRSITAIRLRWSKALQGTDPDSEEEDQRGLLTVPAAYSVARAAQTKQRDSLTTIATIPVHSVDCSMDRAVTVTERPANSASARWPPLDTTWVQTVYKGRCQGKSWAYLLKLGSILADCELTKAEKLKAQLWKLKDGAGSQTIAVHMDGARKKVVKQLGHNKWKVPISVKQREDWGLAIHPRDKLPTFVGSHRLVVGGIAVGTPRRMAASEAAAIMGISRQDGLFHEAAKVLEEKDLWRAVCDSIDVRFAMVLAWNCLDMAGMTAQGGWKPSRPLRMALVFAGAVDPMTEAFRTISGAAVELAVAIEEDDDRMAIIQQVYRPLRAFKEARRAAKFAMSTIGVEIDILHASPSCKLLSTAPHWRQDQLEEKAEKASGELLLDVEAICEIAQKCRPRMISIEETAALVVRKTYAQALCTMWERLEELPYDWRHSVIDVADMGARHHRMRAGWVGCRRDTSDHDIEAHDVVVLEGVAVEDAPT